MTDEATNPPEEELPEPAPALPAPLAALAEASPDAVAEDSVTGQNVFRVPADGLVEFVTSAREAGFEMFIDVTAVDYGNRRPAPRFDVVIGLLSLQHNMRLRILVGIDGDPAAVPSITSVYAGANFYEREVYDLFGIEFPGHPDLTRIMLPDDWEGHPLRKDAPVGSVPIQFRGTHKVQ